jgi:hypothetical protein
MRAQNVGNTIGTCFAISPDVLGEAEENRGVDEFFPQSSWNSRQ